MIRRQHTRIILCNSFRYHQPLSEVRNWETFFFPNPQSHHLLGHQLLPFCLSLSNLFLTPLIAPQLRLITFADSFVIGFLASVLPYLIQSPTLQGTWFSKNKSLSITFCLVSFSSHSLPSRDNQDCLYLSSFLIQSLTTFQILKSLNEQDVEFTSWSLKGQNGKHEKKCMNYGLKMARNSLCSQNDTLLRGKMYNGKKWATTWLKGARIYGAGGQGENDCWWDDWQMQVLMKKGPFKF